MLISSSDTVLCSMHSAFIFSESITIKFATFIYSIWIIVCAFVFFLDVLIRLNYGIWYCHCPMMKKMCTEQRYVWLKRRTKKMLQQLNDIVLVISITRENDTINADAMLMKSMCKGHIDDILNCSLYHQWRSCFDMMQMKNIIIQNVLYTRLHYIF